nr:cation exchanger 9 [Tanacetum cinerariifolium]
MELSLAKCECCGLTRECNFEYIYKIRERYHGKWICGLCGEAIKDEISRGEKLISTKEAMARLINFCKESKPSNKMTEPTIHLIAAMRQIMLRSLDSPRALRGVTVEVLGMIEKRSKVKGIVQTEMELELEQSQQGSSHEVLCRGGDLGFNKEDSNMFALIDEKDHEHIVLEYRGT